MLVLRSLFSLCLLSIASAQYQFLVPSGSVSDFTESWTVGKVMEISWQKGWHGVGDELSSADLWITWFRSDSYSQLLLEDVTFDSAGSLNWRVNVSNAVVKTDDAFVLRLKPHSDPPLYTSTENESPSRGFRLVTGDETDAPSSSSSSFSSSSATSTSFSTLVSTSSVGASTTSATQSSASPTSTLGTTDGSGKSKSLTGAIVGGVVGGLIFVAMLAAIMFLLLRLAKRNKQEQEGGAKELDGATYYAHKGEMGGMGVVEIHGREKPAELSDGSGTVHELGSQTQDASVRSWK
ncbi:hypothetical protein K505DRAFT_371903 [Melanomma pulvis-pyrius CBS 109.77]|uniref:Mid2 domain-containing protein n=1 Tax=Melanomma pulvis-pyrius CBS 109.77 TaxID=1314802 RepID=A0A6A6XRK4_9PLEO|nr:hypothetical protein K505DRAFT_371903 [Melanomma pulvis-pyrius CBS 109.77]